MFQFHLASHLHKTVSEIRQIPAEELVYWYAYLDIQRMERKAAEHRARFAARKR